MQKKIVISHPTSNQNNRNLVQALYKKKLLLKFITSINLNTKKFPLNILPTNFKKFLNKRSFLNIPQNRILTRPQMITFFHFLKDKIFNQNNFSQEYEDLDLFTSMYIKKNYAKIKAVYAYEMGCSYSFKIAKKNNIKCIYELPIGYWRTKIVLLKDEFDLFKNFGIDLPVDNYFYKKRKDLELNLADLVIVPSFFVKKTLLKSKIDKKKIIVIPYGFPPINKKLRTYKKKKKLEILFVGILSPMKGLFYLSRIIKKLEKTHKDKFNFTIIGSGPLEEWLKNELPNTTFKKNLSHKDVLKEMSLKDIFLFPSLFEGFGLVISEAMSCGMVVISTHRTGLKDISKGNDSILVPPKSISIVYKEIISIIENPKKFKIISINAIKTAKKYNWKIYQDKLADTIKKI